MGKIIIYDFKRYCKQNLKIDEILERVEDRRRRPQIKTNTVTWAIVNMVSMGIKSLLELDQIGRLLQMRRYTGSKRYMVASDTTYDRVLKLILTSSIRKAIKGIYRKMQAENLDQIKLDSGKQLRIAGIDASGFGKHLASVVSIFGKIQIVLDAEPYLQKGKELPSSYQLIRRVTRQLGKGWCDILVGDGLYKPGRFFRLCKEGGFDGLVKTKETRLEVIKDALGLYKNDDTSLERKSGFDLNRLCDYEIEAVGDITIAGLKHKLKVVHVKEYYPKQERREEFFVITTNQDLTASECRELAHRRWVIENNVFRQLNQTIKSKRVHTHNQKVLTSLLLLWYIGFNLVNAFLFKCSHGSFRQTFGMARQTFSIKISHMRLSLVSGYG